ncbi:hypothetical protein V6Z12_D11G121400 [Gossypium hirsutum]
MFGFYSQKNKIKENKNPLFFTAIFFSGISAFSLPSLLFFLRSFACPLLCRCRTKTWRGSARRRLRLGAREQGELLRRWGWAEAGACGGSWGRGKSCGAHAEYLGFLQLGLLI